jgi:diguanylate cyclase (GGDEF)-like protein
MNNTMHEAMSHPVTTDRDRVLPYNTLWRNFYRGRTAMLCVLTVTSFANGLPRVALLVGVVIVPFSMFTFWFHAKTRSAHLLLPADQVLAGLCLLISPRVAAAVVMCQMANAVAGRLGRPAQHVRVSIGIGALLTIISAMVHRDLDLLAFSFPAAGACIFVAQITDFMVRRSFGAETRTLDLLDGLNAAIYEADLTNSRITFTNQRALNILGNVQTPLDMLSVVHPDDVERATRLIQAAVASFESVALELRIQENGGYVWMESRTTFSRLKASVRMRTVLFDTTERKALEEELEFRSLHDPLTKLPNRAFLSERLELAIAHMESTGEPVALLALDLDQFKPVNDDFGHGGGDRLLVEIAERLRQAVRTTDAVARVGGDEFAIVLTRASEPAAKAAAQHIVDAVAADFVIDGVRLVPAVSVGIACAPDHGLTPTDLLRRADTAMYRAKRARLGYAVYDADLDEKGPSPRLRESA